MWIESSIPDQNIFYSVFGVTNLLKLLLNPAQLIKKIKQIRMQNEDNRILSLF